MRRSDLFLPASRERRSEGSDATRLAERAGLVRSFGSGLYGFAPAGERVRRKLVALLRRELDAVGGQAVSLPALQYRARWAESGRWGAFEGEMFTLESRDGRAMCLAPSHEEGVVELVDGWVRSYGDLPLLLYQVGEKYRDDHARRGLVRTKAFTMADAYSLHASEESLRATYEDVREAFLAFFDAVGLAVAVCAADSGVMGGAASEEFVAPVPDGADRLRYCEGADCRFGRTAEHADFAALAGADCPECGGALAESDGLEVAHCFRLGERYSDPAGLTVDAPDGEQLVQMGSYGVGVTRTLAALLGRHADGEGARWPVTDAGCVAPYRAAVVPLRYEGELAAAADGLYDRLGHADTLLYDGDRTIGERFAERALLGVPVAVVLGNDYLETGRVELETRNGDTHRVDPGDVADAVTRLAGDPVPGD